MRQMGNGKWEIVFERYFSNMPNIPITSDKYTWMQIFDFIYDQIHKYQQVCIHI